jgi:tripartite-type tricarboxylate transporter receptor subunit TctC
VVAAVRCILSPEIWSLSRRVDVRAISSSLAIALAAFVLADAAFAQTYPTRPITVIVPYAAGGSVDAVARIMAPRLGDRLGQSVLIENVAGAGGIVGTQRAARATPDGYTLLFSVESTMAIAKLVQPSTVQYDSQKDFSPISLIGTSPLVLAGKKTLPADTTDELIKLLRANPGKFNYATSGTGTSLHVAGEMINIEGRVSMVHVPYRVGAQMVTDLVGNQIDLAMLPLVMALPNLRSGNIKAFGTTEPKRSPVAPDLPSLAEHSDLKNVNVTVWFGLFAPAKTDAAVVTRLHQAVADALQVADVRAKLAETGLRVVGNSPSKFAEFLAKEIEKFTAIVKAANIKAE